jgi:hypothetical protein
MSKAKAVAAPEPIAEEAIVFRAVNPDQILEGEYLTVKFGYRQPAGAYPADKQKQHADGMIDDCLEWVTGVEGTEEPRKKGLPWSKILPPRLSNQIYYKLVIAYRLTEVEKEG